MSNEPPIDTSPVKLLMAVLERTPKELAKPEGFFTRYIPNPSYYEIQRAIKQIENDKATVRPTPESDGKLSAEQMLTKVYNAICEVKKHFAPDSSVANLLPSQRLAIAKVAIAAMEAPKPDKQVPLVREMAVGASTTDNKDRTPGVIFNKPAHYGTCCENGYFERPHDCMKTPGESSGHSTMGEDCLKRVRSADSESSSPANKDHEWDARDEVARYCLKMAEITSIDAAYDKADELIESYERLRNKKEVLSEISDNSIAARIRWSEQHGRHPWERGSENGTVAQESIAAHTSGYSGDEMAQGALDAIHALLDDGGIPRGTFADDHVRNLVALYNQRGDRIAELEALQRGEIPDNYNLTQRIEESLAYFCDEFPKGNHSEIWSKPISYHCGGITPDDLQAVLSILYSLEPVSVSLKGCLRAIHNIDLPIHALPDDEFYQAIVKAVLDAAGVKYGE